MSQITIIVNGPSGVGKSSLTTALQVKWPRPLVAVAFDDVVAAWPSSWDRDVGSNGVASEPTIGIRVVPGHGPPPSWFFEWGNGVTQLGLLMARAWRTFADAGFDLVIDHVLAPGKFREATLELFPDAFYVGVTCDIDELVRRESARGDRYVGLASGSAAVVHEGMSYDIMIDSTHASSEEIANDVMAALFMGRFADHR